MTRKKRDFTRKVLPDPKYGDIILAKTVNVVMRQGKKSVAERAIYRALDQIQEKTSKDPLKIFHQALENVRPVVEVRSRRVGGATYQVPTEVRTSRAQALAIRWLVQAAQNRSGRCFEDRLTAELLDAAEERGMAVKKREDTHKMAEANKAFAHFRW